MNISGKHVERPGFTLIELMVVIAIIAIIASVAIPNLLRARASANEASAISSLRTLVSSQAMFYQGDVEGDATYEYAEDLEELEDTGMIDDVLGSGQKQGYCFILFAHASSSWHAHAEPAIPGETGDRSFYVDETGILRWTHGSGGDQRSQPLGDLSVEPSPSTDHRHGEAPACQRRTVGRPVSATISHTALSAIHRLSVFVEKEMVDRALGMSKRQEIQRIVLTAMDKNQDASLTFQEVLQTDVLGVAKTIKGVVTIDPAKDRVGGKDATLKKVTEWFMRKTTQALHLGIANEKEWPNVPIESMLDRPSRNDQVLRQE